MHMLKPVKAFLILIGWTLLLTPACKGPSEKNEDGTHIILKSPPYASLTDSIRLFPQLASLYFRRGDLLSRNNQHELAEADYRNAWTLQPDEETGLRYASTLSITNKPAEALRLLQECTLKYPGNIAFKRMAGELYVQAGQTARALGLFDTMLQADSADFEAWYEKGLLLEQVKDTSGAIGALLKAWTIQPLNTYALELAHIYAESGNKSALQLCNQVIRKDSAGELTDPYFIKGIYYSNTGAYKNAITQFDSCIRRDWKFTEAYLEKGIAFFKQKNYDEALHTFRMTATVSNTYPDAYFWIGRCYEASKKKEEARQFYERALSLDKRFTEAREALNRVK